MLDGNGLSVCAGFKGGKSPGTRFFRVLFWTLTICLAALVLGKIWRGYILKNEHIRYYPKEAIPQPFKTRAEDLDLAMVIDDTARRQMADAMKNDPRLQEEAKQSILFPYLRWFENQVNEGRNPSTHLVSQEGWADKQDAAAVASGGVEKPPERRGLRDLERQLRSSFAKVKKSSKKTEAAVLKEPASLPPEDYGQTSVFGIIPRALCDRLDDALFLNTLGLLLFVISFAGALHRANAFAVVASGLWLRVAIGCLIGGLYFAFLQWRHFDHDHGPLHGWFATESFRASIKYTQWADGVLAIIANCTAGCLLVSFVPWCRSLLADSRFGLIPAYQSAVSDAVSTPIRVIRVLVLILIWMFAAEFFRFFDQHLKVPEAAGTLWMYVAFVLATLWVCARHIPGGVRWSVSAQGITIGAKEEKASDGN